jgi:DNA-binding GntR family transcriptional regulator
VPSHDQKLVNQLQSLSREGVVEAIRQRILRGDLVPGQRLVEADLCEMLGASRGTIRAAFMDLAHEGLIERIANRGARVRIVSLEEALQIVEVRMVVESLCVESLCVSKAAEKITDHEIAALRELGSKLGDRAAHDDLQGFAQLTHQIFEFYVRIANQRVAEEVLARLRVLNSRHRFRLTYRAGRPQVSLPYWLELIDAIAKRDPKAARDALRRHADNVRDSMVALAAEDTHHAPANLRDTDARHDYPVERPRRNS